MGLDELHLRVLAASSDNPKEKVNARKGMPHVACQCSPLMNALIVLNIMQKGRHWVLVVLLLGNVVGRYCYFLALLDTKSLLDCQRKFANFSRQCHWWRCSCDRDFYRRYCHIWRVSSLNIMILPPDLLLTRVIPQAVSVRYGLSIGATCAPLVLGMMYLFAPIAWPVAKLLDWILGANEQHTYKKAELKSFLQFHRTGEEPLRDDEINILNGVLELNTKNVETIMTPLKDTVVLSADAVLDHKAVDAILLSGYSRFPVHEPGNPLAYIGLLLIKKLLNYDPSKALPVSAFPLLILPEALPSVNCFQALDYFQTGRAHLLLISRTPGKPGGALGVITLEDIIEEILSEEIVDETDRYEDNQSKKRAKRLTSATVMRGIVERRIRSASLDHEQTPLLQGLDRTVAIEGYGTRSAMGLESNS
ncbi:hypothetical protein Ac2012v2_000039 [Leucoagaricus gongylophorus]